MDNLTRSITASHNEFALNVLRKMTLDSKNSVVYSPSSASFVLAALLVGAEGDTKNEIHQLLAKGSSS
jgi:serine protease inhibitor